MTDDWDEFDEVIVAGAKCPTPDCVALAVTCKPPDYGLAQQLEFTCPRCGIDFTVPEAELVFQSVPKQWLFAGVHAA